MANDIVECPHCGENFLPKLVMYSYPARTTCLHCGEQVEVDPRIKIMTEQEARKKYPEYFNNGS